MTGRIATAAFPSASRIVRGEDEWEIYRAAHRGDVEDADAYLGSIYIDEDGYWYAVHAIHTYDLATGLDYTGKVTAPVRIAATATTTERNSND